VKDGAPYQEVDAAAGTNIFSTLGSDRADIVPGVPIRARGTFGGFPVYLNAYAFAIPALCRRLGALDCTSSR
jgi:hypothetical protein